MTIEKRVDSSEKLAQKEMFSSPIEKKAVFTTCMEKLMSSTSFEVNGELTDEGIDQNNTLRSVVAKLAIDLGKDKQIAPEEWLLMGITDFITDEKLQEWANPSKIREWSFYQKAKYFLNKQQSNPQDKSK